MKTTLKAMMLCVLCLKIHVYVGCENLHKELIAIHRDASPEKQSTHDTYKWAHSITHTHARTHTHSHFYGLLYGWALSVRHTFMGTNVHSPTNTHSHTLSLTQRTYKNNFSSTPFIQRPDSHKFDTLYQ